VILLTVAGWAASRYLGLKSGTLVGLLVGMVVANFVPAKTACGIRSAPPAREKPEREPAGVSPDRPE
jgi:hypothetical protein